MSIVRSARKGRRSNYMVSKAVVEALEPRVLLSTVVVNTLSDQTHPFGSTTVSLRDAIDWANSAGGDQNITFNQSLFTNGSATIHLNGSALALADMTGTLLIDGGGVTIDGGGSSTVLTNTGEDALIESLTISGGAAGGGVVNSGTLEVFNCTFKNNVAASGAGGLTNSGTLSLYDSTVSGNTGPNGGGIENSGELAITNSTLSGNTANGNGGGLYNQGTATLIDSTISGNTSTNHGGGIYNYRGDATIIDSTISGNSAVEGGGIYAYYVNYRNFTALEGTIIAGNTGGDLGGGNISGTYNLVGDGVLDGLVGSTNLTGEPLLSALGNYGGATETIMPLPMSGGNPAIGHGGVFGGITTDQRGEARTPMAPDMGAVQGVLWVVNTLNDQTESFGSSTISLRDAVNQANALGDNALVTFSSSLNGPIDLMQSLGRLVLDDMSGALNIEGPGAGTIQVSGGGHVEVMDVHSGSSASISGLKIEDGYTSAAGGGIENQGTLTISDCTITSNTSSGNNGGGVGNVGGTLTVAGSMISDNSGYYGGGLYNSSTGHVTISGSTITGNNASQGGGGIYDAGALTIQNDTFVTNNTTYLGGGGGLYINGVANLSQCTISGNSTAGGGGGGIRNNNGDVTLTDSLVTDNHATQSNGGGIENESTLQVTGSQLTYNSSEDDGGGIDSGGSYSSVAVTSCTISHNTAVTDGGGINSGSALTVSGSTLEYNSAQSGGGIATGDSCTVSGGSEIADNTASLSGGGIDNSGGFTFSGATLASNEAKYGAGFYNAGTATISGSALIENNGNSTTVSGGGIYNAGNLTVASSTLSGNSAHSGAGVYSSNSCAISASSYIGDNTSTLAGGGIDNTGTLTLSGSTAKSNIAKYGAGINNTGTATIGGSSTIESNGNSSTLAGGGIENSGTLSISNSTISGNSARIIGGGIFNFQIAGNSQSGALSINGVAFNDNSATAYYHGYGGGIANGNSSANNYSALVHHGGSVTISNSTLTGNIAEQNGGGISTYYGSVAATDCTFTDNKATVPQYYEYAGGGGAIFDLVGNLTVAGSTFTGNTAPYDSSGGAIDCEVNNRGEGSLSVSGSYFYDNSAQAGGAINNVFGTATVTGCVISGNTAANGAGINTYSAAEGELVVSDSTISGNIGSGIGSNDVCKLSHCLIEDNSGSGVYGSGYLYVDSSFISQNTGFDGGGIEFTGTVLTISNSTIANNTVTDSSGTGGINCGDTTLTIVNSTIADNSGFKGGGVSARQSPVTITDSTISGNTASGDIGGGLRFEAADVYGTSPYVGPPAVSGTIISGNTGGDFYGELYAVNDCGVTGADNLIGGSALLAQLGNYGGVTAGADDYGQTPQTLETVALLPGSPALDAGGDFDDAVGNAIGSDERGISRPTSLSDIGAFQSQGFNVTITGGNSQNAFVNTPFSDALAVQVTSNDPGLANLDGGVVTFIAPSTGASAVLGTNQIIDAATIYDSGDAYVSASADDTAGGYGVIASATPDATSSSTTFSLNNTGTTPSGLATLSISGPFSVTVGSSYVLTLVTSDASLNTALTWTINWGDGSPNSTVSNHNNDLGQTTHLFTVTSPGQVVITATAVDGAGNLYTAGAQLVAVVVPGSPSAPPAPAPPTGLVVVQAIYGEIDLAWNPTTNPNIVGYNVYAATDPSFTPSAANNIAADVTSDGYTDNFFSEPNATWYYKVTAVDSQGDESAPSAAVGALMPQSTPDNYTDAPDLAPLPPEGFSGPNDGSIVPDTSPTSDVIAFYGAGSTTAQGNFSFAQIVSSIGSQPGMSIQHGVAYRDWQGESKALPDLLRLLDTNGDGTITPAEIAAQKIYVLGYSWGAIEATNFTRWLSKPDPHAGGIRKSEGKGDRTVYVGGWNLEAPVPIQVLDTIDPVLYAFGLSFLLRNTQGPLANVIKFNNYYQQKGGWTTPGLYLNGVYEEPASQAVGNLFSAQITGSMLSSHALNTNQVDVTTSWSELLLEGPFFYDDFGNLIYGGLTGSQVQHDTMPMYLYSIIVGDI